MKAISLFSGAGGFELGFDRAGIETVLQVENDPWCLEVLARHWPDVERITDVRDVGRGSAERGADRRSQRHAGSRLGAAQQPWAGVDLIYGGFPCQDVSQAGKRAGLAGDRSGLWFEFERIVSELRPRWAVVENVPGLLSSNEGRDFAVILDGLDELGFDAAWAVLDAQHFSVAQRRHRVFVVAGPRGRGPEQVLAVCESCGGHHPPSLEAGQDVAGAGGLGAGGGRGRAGRADLDTGGALVAPIGSLEGVHHALSARDAKGVGSNVAQAVPVVAAGGVRRLTPLEWERLQGWPDDWTRYTADDREISDSQRYRMIGNGVSAPVAEWLGRQIVAIDGQQP